MAERNDVLVSVLWDMAAQRPSNTGAQFAAALFGVSARKCRAILRSCIDMCAAGDAQLLVQKWRRGSARTVPVNKKSESEVDAIVSFLEVYTRTDPETKWRQCTSPDMNGMRALYNGWVKMYPEIKCVCTFFLCDNRALVSVGVLVVFVCSHSG